MNKLKISIISCSMEKENKLSEKLLNYKNVISTDSNREISNFEKNFLFLSTGFFSFTLVFVKDILDINESKLIFLIQFSWLSLVISIGLIMFTFLKSQWVSDNAWDYLDAKLAILAIDDENDPVTKDSYNEIKTVINNRFKDAKKSLKKIRLLAIFFFLLGIILMASFININFYNSKTNEHGQKTATISACKSATCKATKSTYTTKDSTSRSTY